MIDFFIRFRDTMDIHSIQAMRGANFCTEQQMLRSNVTFRIRQKHNMQRKSKPRKLSTAKLSIISHGERFEHEMDSARAQREDKESLTPHEE